jgi:hypothetical protein
MRKKWMPVVLALSFVLPTARLWAEDEKRESAKDERAETIEERQHEEQEAMSRYQKAVAKHGQESMQAKKAWKHVLAEYKEHGDTPPQKPAADMPPSEAK